MIDPRIALGIQPPRISSPMETAGRAMQLQGMQQQRQLQAMQLAEAQQTQRQNAEMQGLAQQAGGDLPKLIQSLHSRGLTQQAMGLEKLMAERQKSQADLGKTQADTAKVQMDLLRGSLAFLSRNPSDQAITSTLGGMTQRGLLPPEVVQAFGTDLLRLPPEQRARALAEASRTPEQLAALYSPNMQKIDDGQQISFRDVNPLTGGPQAPVQRQMTPGEQRAAADAAAGRAVTMRGQDMTAQTAAARLQWEQANPPLISIETGNGPMVMGNRGQTPARPVLDANGRPLPPKMSEATKKEIDGLDSQSAAIQSALQSVADTPSAFNFWRGAATLGGAIPESIAGRTDSDEERKARAFVFNNVSKVINERAGAAQSAQELARLRSFLPAETDNAEQVTSKLQAFQEYLAVQRQSYATPVSERPQANPSPAPAVAPKAASAPTWNSLPMPREVPEGAVVRDTQSGQRFRRRGDNWEPVR